MFGGVTGDYSVAPLEIQMGGNPRVSFHWPGVVASQLGMDSAGTIRTFDNPGTGYAAFACGPLNSGTINTGAIVCTSINSQGYGVYFGPVGCGGITCTNINTQGYNITTGSLNSNTAIIGDVRFDGNVVTGGIPTMRAAAGAHLVINAVPLYLQLDAPGNQVLCYGPFNMTRGDTLTAAHIYPITANTYTLGHPGAKWAGACFSLQPAPAGSIYVQTGGDGWLYYLPSTRALKRDIAPMTLDHAQEVVEKIIPVRYRDAADEKQEKPLHAGFIVEDMIDANLPELVGYYNDKPASVQYDKIAVYLSVVVKDMQRRINELEARIH
jgi:hypothetical protein